MITALSSWKSKSILQWTKLLITPFDISSRANGVDRALIVAQLSHFDCGGITALRLMMNCWTKIHTPYIIVFPKQIIISLSCLSFLNNNNIPRLGRMRCTQTLPLSLSDWLMFIIRNVVGLGLVLRSTEFLMSLLMFLLTINVSL